MKVAIVIGSAKNWDIETAAALALAPRASIYCVKETGIDYPTEFACWVTMHPEWMLGYIDQRHRNGLPPCKDIVCPPSHDLGTAGIVALRENPKLFRLNTYLFKGCNASGGSGLYGVKCALDDGHSHVIGAGMPMLLKGGHYRRGGELWKTTRGELSPPEMFYKGWEQAKPHLAGRFRCMTGWTAEQFGEPTRRWLQTGG